MSVRNTTLRREQRKRTLLFADSLKILRNMKHWHWEELLIQDTHTHTHTHTHTADLGLGRETHVRVACECNCPVLVQYHMNTVLRLFTVILVLILAQYAVTADARHLIIPVRVLTTFKFKCFVKILPEGHCCICTTQSSQQTQMSH